MPLLAVIGLALVVAGAWWAAGSERPRSSAPTSVSALESSSSDISTALSDASSNAARAPELESTSPSAPASSAEATTNSLAVTGRVVFPSGTPADERVSVLASALSAPDDDARAFDVAADGTFRAELPPDATRGKLQLRARYLFLRNAHVLEVAKIVEPVVLEPELGGALRGRCAVPDGFELARLAGTEASARGRRLEIGSRTSHQPLRTARIGDDGAFEFGGLAPDAQYTIQVERSALAPFEGGAYSIDAGRVRDVEIALERGATVAGRVVDESGAPSAGCAVGLASPIGLPSFDDPDATTDDAGRFRIEGVAPGKTLVRAKKDGYLVARSKLIDVEAGAVIDGVELQLERGAALRGRVQWPDGAPAANATLRLALGTDPTDQLTRLGWWQPRDATSAADGSFAFEGLTEGPFALLASATSPAHGACSAFLPKNTPGGPEPVVVALQAGHTLAVRVVDDLGAPHGGCAVEATSGNEALGDLETPIAGVESAPGAFELRGLRRGQWTLTARRGGGKVERKVDVPHDGALEVVLPRSVRIAGIVRDVRGAALAGARVSIRGESAHELYGGGEGTIVRTEADGRFRSPELAPGSFTLQARSLSSAPSEATKVKLRAGEERADVELLLRDGGTLAIQVLDDRGAPEAGRRVDVMPINVAGAIFSSDFTTDTGGRVTIPHVPPGQYQIQTSPSASEMQAATDDRGRIDAMKLVAVRRMATTTVVDGETSDVTLAPSAREPIRVSARVTSRGKPIGALQVRAMAHTGQRRTESVRTAMSDSEGRFALELAGPGSYAFHFRAEHGGSSSEHERSIPDQPSVALDFELPGGRIAGRTVDADRNGVARVPIMLRPKDTSRGMFISTLESRDDGGFAFEYLPAGTYSLSTAPPWSADGSKEAPYAIASRDGVELAEDGAIDGIELVLVPGGAIEGDVVGGSGERVPEAHVFAFDAEKRLVDPWRSTSDAAGHFRLTGIAPGAARVFARTEGLVAKSTAVNVRAGETASVKLVLVPGTLLGIRLFEEDGNQIGSPIALHDEHGFDHSRAWTRRATQAAPKDLYGFRVGPLAPGRYFVSAADGSLGGWSASIDVTGGETQQVDLKVPKR